MQILTVFLTPQCSQEQDLNNGTIPSQNGPQYPQGGVLKFIHFANNFLLTFRFRALSLTCSVLSLEMLRHRWI